MKTPVPLSLKKFLQAALSLPSLHIAASSANKEVQGLACDSRKVVKGSIFVALPGSRTDGHLYVEQAIQKGCIAVIVEKDQIDSSWDIPCVLVEDAQVALGKLASAWYGYPAKHLCCIGVTGTNGKTTISWLIEGMLTHAGYQVGVIGTVNYRFRTKKGEQVTLDAPLTTPDVLTLQGLLRKMVDAGTSHVVLEVSSHALVQKRLGDIVFETAVFTNLTRDHLDYHQSMEEYFAAKQLLFTHYLAPRGTAVVALGAGNNEPSWGWMLVASLSGKNVVRSGLVQESDIGAEDLKKTPEGFSCTIRAQGKRRDFHSSLVGSFNVQNVLCAASVGLALGLSLDTACQGLSLVHAVPGRLQKALPPGGNTKTFPAVFVDYAHTPDALENVLRTLQEVGKGRLFCLFGCGGDRDRGKRPLMGKLAAQLSDIVLVTSDNPRTEEPERIIDDIIPGLTQGGAKEGDVETLFLNKKARKIYVRVADRRQAIALACALALPEDTILVAGKGHEDYQILGKDKVYFDDCIEAINALARWNEQLILLATQGKKIEKSKQTRLFNKVCTDTRLLAAGDIFLALRGDNFDGHLFIEKAIEKGAAAIIGEQFPEMGASLSQVFCIEVDDSRAALADLARFRRKLFAGPLQVAAITGSSGKTTVKEMASLICEHALQNAWSAQDPLLKTQGNFNNLIGLPLSLLPLNAGHQVAIMEMGMNALGEIAALTDIADPDVGCINTVHPAHLEGLGSIENVAKAKGELFERMRPEARRIVNFDDTRIYALGKRFDGNLIGFAATKAGRKRKATVQVTRLTNLGENGIRFTLNIGTWKRRITVPVMGEYNAGNCASAAALTYALGIQPDLIAEGLERYRPVNKRMCVQKLPGGASLVNDVYNANPASMAAGLRTIAAIDKANRRFAALGDMLELGESSAEKHHEIGKLVAELGYTYLAVSGQFAAAVVQGARAGGMADKSVQIFATPQDIAPWCCFLFAQGALDAGDWIFVKGSRGMRMEGFIEALEKGLASIAKGESHAL